MWVGVFFKVAILPTICASLSLSFSLSFSLSLNPPLVTGSRAPICAVIRPNPACRLGRNIIKTSLCCHGNRDLNKFIFLCVCMCFRGLFGIWLAWRFARLSDRDALLLLGVVSSPLLHVDLRVLIYSWNITDNYFLLAQFLLSIVCTVHVCILQCIKKIKASEMGKDRSVRHVIVNLNSKRKMLSWMNGEKMGQQNTFAPSNLRDRCFNWSLILLRFSPAFVCECSVAGLMFSIYVLYQ